MALQSPDRSRRLIVRRVAPVVAALVVGICIGVQSLRWSPWLSQLANRNWFPSSPTQEHDHTEHDHTEHDHTEHDHTEHDHTEHDHTEQGAEHGHTHDHESSDETLTLSQQALANIGLTEDAIRPIERQTFQRTITIPAIVVERPGRTRIEVATPMAAVVTHVHAVQGEAIPPGALLFELRITAEELVSTQTAMLKTLGELDVERKEIARIAQITQAGALAQKTMIEREYTKERLEALLAAQKEALRLQGLTERQIDDIEKHRRLLRDLRIYAPTPDEHNHEEFELTQTEVRQVSYESTEGMTPQSTSPEQLLVIQELHVHKGQIIDAGGTLAVIMDLSELLIEGQAFEQDAPLLSRAAAEGWTVTAVWERSGISPEVISGLELLYSSNEVDVETRTLRFYARLPNQILRKVPSQNGHMYTDWRYRLGQRMQLRVPVETWTDQFVVPVEAVAQDGPENYVFQRQGNRFRRLPVVVIYRDQSHAVVKAEEGLASGKAIAHRGAHQMQMALKNMASGGIDPHAGHSH